MGHFGGYNCRNKLVPLDELEKFKEKLVAAMGIPKEFLEPPEPEYNPSDYIGVPPPEPVTPTEFIERFTKEEVGVADYTHSGFPIESFTKWALPMVRKIYPKILAEHIVGAEPTFGGLPDQATFVPREYPEDYSTPPQEIDLKISGTEIKANARKLKGKWTMESVDEIRQNMYPEDYTSSFAPLPLNGHKMNMNDPAFFKDNYIYAPFIPVWRTPVLKEEYFSSVAIT